MIGRILLNRFIKYTLFILFLFIFTGCTHKISIAPDVTTISGKGNLNKSNFNVAYILSKDKENLYIVTSEGGGDSVGYYPYKDTESSFRAVLNNLFNKIYKLDSFPNNDFIENNNIKYVFQYEIETHSSSDSSFTWPPTNFVVNLKVTVKDQNNRLHWEDAIDGQGYASFSEFKTDFGLAGKKAVTNALNNLYFKIKTSKEFQWFIN